MHSNHLDIKEQIKEVRKNTLNLVRNSFSLFLVTLFWIVFTDIWWMCNPLRQRLFSGKALEPSSPVLWTIQGMLVNKWLIGIPPPPPPPVGEGSLLIHRSIHSIWGRSIERDGGFGSSQLQGKGVGFSTIEKSTPERGVFLKFRKGWGFLTFRPHVQDFQGRPGKGISGFLEPSPKKEWLQIAFYKLSPCKKKRENKKKFSSDPLGLL